MENKQEIIQTLVAQSQALEQEFADLKQDPLNLNNLLSFICTVSNRLETHQRILIELLNGQQHT